MIRCWLLGHVPRGPVPTPAEYVFQSPPYRCARCHRLIVFVPKRGWVT